MEGNKHSPGIMDIGPRIFQPTLCCTHIFCSIFVCLLAFLSLYVSVLLACLPVQYVYYLPFTPHCVAYHMCNIPHCACMPFRLPRPDPLFIVCLSAYLLVCLSLCLLVGLCVLQERVDDMLTIFWMIARRALRGLEDLWWELSCLSGILAARPHNKTGMEPQS